uniref:Uncharacterized protein n=1 Tax=Arundo donax TaxID=35708 RepID=A0A0A8Z1Z4_ARUDO
MPTANCLYHPRPGCCPSRTGLSQQLEVGFQLQPKDSMLPLHFLEQSQATNTGACVASTVPHALARSC